MLYIKVINLNLCYAKGLRWKEVVTTTELVDHFQEPS